MTGCKVDGCDRPHSALGWCARHYVRAHGHDGDPQAGRPIGERWPMEANPWAGRLDCPRCGSSVWTMPHDERRYPGLWTCCGCSYDWSVRPRSDSVR